MIRLYNTFTNQGPGEYNDHVFPGVPFPLKDKSDVWGVSFQFLFEFYPLSVLFDIIIAG
jgi:hypothetical protein